MALYPNQWYALMRKTKGLTEGNEDLLKIEVSPFYPFAIIKDSGKFLTLRSCRGLEYKVDKSSFAKEEVRQLGVGDMITTKLFKYKDHWRIGNAISASINKDLEKTLTQLEYMAEHLVDDSGRYIDLAGNVDEHAPNNLPDGKIYDALKCKRLIDNNNSDRIFYFKNMAHAVEWLRQNLFDTEEEGASEIIETGPLAVFISEKCQFYVVERAEVINDPNNPYYKEDSGEELLDALANPDLIPNPMVGYMVENNFVDGMYVGKFYGVKQAQELMAKNVRFFLTYLRNYPF